MNIYYGNFKIFADNLVEITAVCQNQSRSAHGDGDPRVCWLEQVAAGQFETRVLVSDVPQSSVEVADLNSDGIAEVVVSSYEANKCLLVRVRSKFTESGVN